MAGNSLCDLKWVKLDMPNNCPRPRHGHRAVAIKNQIIVFGGGNVGIIDGINVYNTETNKWSTPNCIGNKPYPCAAYGLVVDYERNLLFLFGGMLEFGRYSNALYMLNVSNWEWKLLKATEVHGETPCPRLGHSFTLVDDKKIILFGGLANDGTSAKNNIPRYLNDLFILNVKNEDYPSWEVPQTIGICPSARESHTAVYYSNKRSKDSYVVIYGGMSGRRLGDLWLLNTKSMCWSQPQVSGIPPLPRSLHSASLLGNRMFVFGGWVPVEKREKLITAIPKCDWECTNMLSCLNLENMSWEDVKVDTNESKAPPPRAGHCMVGMETRLYLWSGRDGYRKSWKHDLVCFKDMWYIEVIKPLAPGRATLQRSLVNRLEINWECLQSPLYYLVQLQKYANPPQVGESKPLAVDQTAATAPAAVQVRKPVPQTTTPIQTVQRTTSLPVIKSVGNIMHTQQPDVGSPDNTLPVVRPLIKQQAAQSVFSVAVNSTNQGLQISDTSLKSAQQQKTQIQSTTQFDNTSPNVVSVAGKPMAKQIIIKSNPQVVKTISMSGQASGESSATPVSLGSFQVQTAQSVQSVSPSQQSTQVGISPSGRVFKIVKAIPKSNLVANAKTITTKTGPGGNPMKIIKLVGDNVNRPGGNVQVTRTISGQPSQMIKMINPDNQNQNIQFVSRPNPVFVVTTGTNIQNIQTISTSQANLNKDGGQTSDGTRPLTTQVIMSSSSGNTNVIGKPLTLTVPGGQKTINIQRGQQILNSGQIVTLPSNQVVSSSTPQRVMIRNKVVTLMGGQKMVLNQQNQKIVLPSQQVSTSAAGTTVAVSQSQLQQSGTSVTQEGPQKFMIFRTKPPNN